MQAAKPRREIDEPRALMRPRPQPRGIDCALMLAPLAAHTQHMPVAQVADPHGIARAKNLRRVLFMFPKAVVRRGRAVVKRVQRCRAIEAAAGSAENDSKINLPDTKT
jgi:hypothetical protein